MIFAFWDVDKQSGSSPKVVAFFSGTKISSNITSIPKLNARIQTNLIFVTKFSSIYLANGEKRLVFQPSIANLPRAKDGTHVFEAKYRYVFVV